MHGLHLEGNAKEHALANPIAGRADTRAERGCSWWEH